MKKNDQIIATDIGGPAGAVVYWSLHAGSIAYEKLKEAWLGAGNDASDLPQPTSHETALRRVVDSQKSKRILSRPMAKRANWSLIQERVDNDDSLTYDTLARAWLDKDLGLQVEGPPAECIKLISGFCENVDSLTSDDVSKWLGDMLPKFAAVRLRPSGGVYFVPDADAFAVIAQTVESICKGMIDVELIPAMKKDSVVKAVLNGLLDEVQSFIASVDKQIAGGVGKLGLTHRTLDCDHQLERLNAYESMLGDSLVGVKEQIDAVKSRAVLASMKADGV